MRIGTGRQESLFAHVVMSKAEHRDQSGIIAINFGLQDFELVLLHAAVSKCSIRLANYLTIVCYLGVRSATGPHACGGLSRGRRDTTRRRSTSPEGSMSSVSASVVWGVLPVIVRNSSIGTLH